MASTSVTQDPRWAPVLSAPDPWLRQFVSHYSEVFVNVSGLLFKPRWRTLYNVHTCTCEDVAEIRAGEKPLRLSLPQLAKGIAPCIARHGFCRAAQNLGEAVPACSGMTPTLAVPWGLLERLGWQMDGWK